MVIWEVYRCFQGDFFDWVMGLRGGGCVGELSIEEFFMGEENFNEGSTGFSSILK